MSTAALAQQKIEDAVKAREAIGLSVEEAARKARITVAYLRNAERHGCSFVLAERLARLYECRIDVFLPKGGGTPSKKASRRSRKR